MHGNLPFRATVINNSGGTYQSSLLSLLLFFVTSALTPGAYSAPEDGLFVPDSGVLLTLGQDVDSINDYVTSVGQQPAGVTN